MSAYTDKAIALGADVVLDGVSGSTWEDATTNNRDATIVGALTTTGPGEIPTAVSFDGVDDYASIPNATVFQWNADVSFTFGCWVKRTGSTPGRYAPFYGAGNTTANSGTTLRQYDENYGRIEANGSWMLVGRYGTTPTLTQDEWFFVAVTNDQTTVRFYFGNTTTAPTQYDSSTVLTTKSATDGGLYIGAELYDNVVRRFYPAAIAGAFVFPTALSLANLDALYDETFVSSGVSVSPSGLIVVSAVSSPSTTQNPVEPGNFAFTAHASETQLDGSWDAGPNANMYDVEIDEEVSLGNWSEFDHFSTTELSFQRDLSDGVNTGTTYRSRIRSRNIAANSYRDLILIDTPVNYWRFEEISGGVVDETGNASNGTVYGANLNVPGVKGSGILFDGVDDYVAVDHVAGVTSGLTWEAWIYRVSTASDQMFIGYQGDAAFYLRVVSSRLFGSIRTSGGQKSVWGDIVLATETWHHVVLRFDGTTLELYVDGQFDVAHAEDLSATTLSSWGINNIGRWTAADPRWFGGKIDEVATYDYALSPQQIYDNYIGMQLLFASYQQEVLEDSPIAYWRFKETSGTTAADEVGTNDGTVYGADLSVAGQVGSGARFDGVDDSIQVPYHADLSPSTFTIELLINVHDTKTYMQRVISNRSHIYEGWEVVIESGRLLFSYGRTESNNSTVVISEAMWFVRDVWHHVAITFDGTTLKGYRNGMEAYSATTTVTSQDGTHPFMIGNIDWAVPGERSTPAFLDEVALYSTALSQARIQAHYDASVSST